MAAKKDEQEAPEAIHAWHRPDFDLYEAMAAQVALTLPPAGEEQVPAPEAVSPAPKTSTSKEK